MMIRTYSELSMLPTFEERFQYLQLKGAVGEETFGFDRFINQQFYRSPEWKRIRDIVILRDNGCDLGIEGYEIRERILIHHMNTVSVRDLEARSEFLLNPEYLITTTHNTHNAIHYGDEELLITAPKARVLNDTCPWKR
nr:MAG TPA: HNH endonuclease bacteriophage, HNH Endonuclease, DNA.52A [Caudoviricetes sp.]